MGTVTWILLLLLVAVLAQRHLTGHAAEPDRQC
jgi:hypothetical protein